MLNTWICQLHLDRAFLSHIGEKNPQGVDDRREGSHYQRVGQRAKRLAAIVTVFWSDARPERVRWHGAIVSGSSSMLPQRSSKWASACFVWVCVHCKVVNLVVTVFSRSRRPLPSRSWAMLGPQVICEVSSACAAVRRAC